MNLSENGILRYRCLASFLGEILNEDYAVGLYEGSDLSKPLYQSEKVSLDENSFRKAAEAAERLPFDYLCGFSGQGTMPEIKKAALFPVRNEEGGMTGFLLIVKKFSEKVDLKTAVESMLKSEEAVQETSSEKDAESLNMEKCIREILYEKTSEIFSPYAERGKLKKSDKVELMRRFFDAGITKMRGGMQVIAEVTGISQASLYRYLMEVIEE